MAYTTAFGLPKGVVDYLNEAYPDYSGIFPSNASSIGSSFAPSDAEVLKETFLAQSGTGGMGGVDDDNYSVYNPDPNRIQMPIAPPKDYGYPTDYQGEEPNKGVMGLIDTIADSSIWNKLAGTIGDNMPINESAILQKAARQQGFALDDIGRIVVKPNDPNNPLNIMAGYNLNRMSPETFDKRIRNLKLTGDAYRNRVNQINAARKAWEEANRLKNIRYDARRNLKLRKELEGTGIQTNYDLGHGTETFSGGQGGEFDNTISTPSKSTSTGGWSPGSGNQGTTPGAGLHADYNRGGIVNLWRR